MRNMNNESQSEEKVPAYPVYGPNYGSSGVKKINIWKDPLVRLWIVISGFLTIGSAIGFFVIYAKEITVEQLLVAMFCVGSVSTIFLVVYWLTFHDIKSEA